ncbi:pilus assembly protein PilP [Geobacter sp. FeAm09]|uniref:pilus assembly protein PilP n=1 Tax=Geobacter sp. FeAm09 TaxID=2597769 RepID=UPI0011EBD538|nr:pilus assembly protein PilP [Geobacter sp. FeAm09]QEM67976.1 pilus assembly protein PilP [Geobacter sp. FeAm09]
MIRRNLLPNSRSVAVVVAVGIVAAMLPGCKKHEQPAPAAQPAAKAAAPQQPKPVQKPVSSALKLPPPPVNQFDFSNKKDPFKPFLVVKPHPAAPAAGTAARISRSGLPIHSFDVSQFRLIGVVTGDRQNKAMVVDPNGKGYVLRVGMSIGKNEGTVTSISNSGVDVLEQFRDDNGRVRKETIKITLPRK